MSKIRIYIKPERIDDFIEIVEKKTIHKIRDVLRLKKDEELYVFDGEGKEYLCRIKDIKKNSVLIKKEKTERKEDYPRKKIILGFPLLKEEKVNSILHSATELGVFSFIPFISSRSIRVEPSSAKLERWTKIVIEATRQSERLWVPKIYPILDFKEIIKNNCKIKFAASVEGRKLTKVNKEVEEVLLLVGPEGDFSHFEYAKLKENNFHFINLSPYFLRTETAALFAVGLINYFLNKN